MKVTRKIDANTSIDIDLPDLKKVFQFMAKAETMFGVKKCGNCSSPNLALQHKTPGGFEYYSVKCNDCGYEHKFGQQKETGDLFPKGWEPPFKKGEERAARDDQYDSRDEPANEASAPRGRQTTAARNDDIDF